MTLDKYDIALLKLLNGEEQDVFRGWGAALGLTLGKARNMGTVRPLFNSDGSTEYEVTELGQQYLESQK